MTYFVKTTDNSNAHSTTTTNAGGSLGIGYQALIKNTGNNNIALGSQAGTAAVNATDCVYIGTAAGGSNVSGALTVAVGSNSLGNSTGPGKSGSA